MNAPICQSRLHPSRSKWVLFILVLALSLLINQSAATQTQFAGGYFGPKILPRPLQGQEFLSFEDRQTEFLSSDRGVPLATAEGWQTYPLFGGEMTSIAAHPVNPKIVYVGTRDAGVFKTTDGGQSWQPARNGLTFFPIRSLRIDPQHPNTLYAGTDFDGVWKSTNGGANWADSSNGLAKNLVILNVVIDPQDTQKLYAAMAGGPGLYIGHIYKSENGGASWALQETGIPLEAGDYINGVFSLAVNPANPATVYAGTNYDGAFRSTNGGASWAAINDGLPFRSEGSEYRKAVNALALDPHHGNRLSAIIGGEYYIFQGGQWQLINAGLYDANSSLFSDYLYFHPTDAATIYSAGDSFTLSTDAGINWTQRLGWSDSGNVPELAFHPGTPNTIFAATAPLFDYEGGVYKTIDQGETWAPAWQGISAPTVYGVAIDPQNPDRIYAGTGDGFFYRSQNGGATWSRGYYLRNPEPYQEKDYYFGAISDITVDPVNTNIIYITGTDLYKSTDGGEIFEPIEPVDSPNCIAIHPRASNPIYVGAQFGDGIYKSIDGGQTWSQNNQGLPLFGDTIPPILSLAIDPTHPSTVWAGMQYGEGIVKSTDGGEHWQVKGLTEANFVDAIAVNPDNSDEILVGAGYSSGNIYKSTDGGDTWEIKIEEIAFVRDIVYDPRNSDWVYAATEGYGVLRSFNGGETWHDFSDGIFYPVLYSLAITQDDPPLLVVGSYGSGLYGISPGSPPPLTLLYLPAVQK
jgi:photosystem II stability/assembly factor-like uncharacterized protein